MSAGGVCVLSVIGPRLAPPVTCPRIRYNIVGMGESAHRIPRERLILALAAARKGQNVRHAMLEARAAGLNDVEIAKALGSSATAFGEAYSVLMSDNMQMGLVAQKAATATRQRFRKGRDKIPLARQREVMAKFEAEGRVCAICRKAVAQGEPVDIHHLSPWRPDRNSDRVENLAVAHRSCNQRWKMTGDEHAQLTKRFEAYLATLPVEQANRVRRSVPRLWRGYKLAEFLAAKGF
jgi:hypothetical protein